MRIVVAGNSCSVMVVPSRQSPAEGTYGELLERRLRDHGIDVTVEHVGQWFDLISDFRRRYERRDRDVDVLVLNYGIAECQPNFLPTWLARHFQTWDRSTAPIPRWYRSHVSDRLWLRARTYQRRAAGLTTGVSWRLPPSRFRAEMQRVIKRARETGCLVLIIDIDPPDDRVCHWLPGIGSRWERYQRILRDTVMGFDDPMVRLLTASEHVTEYGFDRVLPDGLHRSAEGHGLTAGLLTRAVLNWRNGVTPRRYPSLI